MGSLGALTPLPAEGGGGTLYARSEEPLTLTQCDLQSCKLSMLRTQMSQSAFQGHGDCTPILSHLHLTTRSEPLSIGNGPVILT